MMNDFGAQFGTGVLVSVFIQWLKRQRWFPFAQFGAFWLNAITSGVAALVSSGALLYTFAANGDFVFQGNIYTILAVIKTAAVQYAIQHYVYKSSIAPPMEKDLKEMRP